MNLSTDIHEGFAIIAIDGRFTASGAPGFRTMVSGLIDAGSVQIVVDFSGCSFVDSSGLGAMIGGLKLARVAGGDLRIAAVPEGVKSVLRLTNLDRVLRSHPTPESAFSD